MSQQQGAVRRFGPAPPAVTATLTLHVLRHGQSDWNAAGIVQGQSDRPVLTELGARQAAAAARGLASAGIEVVYSSDLARAVQTANTIGAALGVAVICSPALREQAMGSWEGRSSVECWTAAEQDAPTWSEEWAAPGGESVRDVYLRLLGFLTDLARGPRSGPVVLVTHGDTGRIALGLLAGHPPGAIPWRALTNGESVAVTCDRAALITATA